MRSFIIVLLLSGIFVTMLLLKPQSQASDPHYDYVTGYPIHPVACLMLIGVFTRCPPPEWRN